MQVELVSLHGGYVLMTNGTVLPVSTWHDDEGCECGPDEASYCIAGSNEQCWWTIAIGAADSGMTLQ